MEKQTTVSDTGELERPQFESTDSPNASAIRTDDETYSIRYRFSILKLMGYTTVIAVIYAMPPQVTTLISAFALATACFASLLLITPFLSRSARTDRAARIERAMIDFLIRAAGYSTLIFVVVMAAHFFKFAVTTYL